RNHADIREGKEGIEPGEGSSVSRADGDNPAFQTHQVADCNMVAGGVQRRQAGSRSLLEWPGVIQVVDDDDAVAVDQHGRLRSRASWSCWYRSSIRSSLRMSSISASISS